VKAASSGPVWFQLYLTGGRAAAEDAIQRAQEAGYSQLVVTIDTTVIDLREREVRDGMDQLAWQHLVANSFSRRSYSRVHNG
jgi:isopentenyl diphosphate isomerase/L-lactate dehydrogenase-like FMN-dependent dehydrogenase